MLGIDRERLQRARAACNLVVPRCHDHVLQRGGVASRLREDVEHRHDAAPPQRRAGGDRGLGTRIGQPLRDRRGGEAGEDRHLHRSDVRAGMRGDRDLRRHRQIDRNAVPWLDADLHQPLGEPRDGVGELCERELTARTVLAAEDGCNALAAPAVDTVPGDVQLRSEEPGRPLGTAGHVDDLRPGLVELEPHVLHRRRPEPLRILHRPFDELAVGREAVAAHQPDDVCVLEHVLVRYPDRVHHGRKHYCC
jgi:hypothetical protein